MTSRIRKAIIPAAGFGTRFLPSTKAVPKEMLPIIDTPTIQYIVQEAKQAGIEEICLITNTYKKCIEDHFDTAFELEAKLEASHDYERLAMVKELAQMVNITAIRQKNPRGLGHAILCAKQWVGEEDFAVLLGDDIVVNHQKGAISQLVDAWQTTQHSVVGVQPVRWEVVHKYGIIHPEQNEGRLTKVNHFVEKPSQDKAPSNLAILGRYVLSSRIFSYLETQVPGKGNEIQLTDAIDRLAQDEAVYAYQFEGRRYDVGDKKGFLQAQVELALEREDTKQAMLDILSDLGFKR